MTIEQLREQLMEAGNKFDGHVTNGSIAAQLKIVAPFLPLLKIARNAQYGEGLLALRAAINAVDEGVK